MVFTKITYEKWLLVENSDYHLHLDKGLRTSFMKEKQSEIRINLIKDSQI